MGKKEVVVFLIDDDEDDKEIFELALYKLNPRIKYHSAKNGDEALSVLIADETFLPDFIFLDLNMPKMNGKKCFSALREIPRLKHIPVFIYTTSSYPPDEKEMTLAGVTSFIRKPYAINTLVKKLEALIFPVSQK